MCTDTPVLVHDERAVKERVARARAREEDAASVFGHAGSIHTKIQGPAPGRVKNMWRCGVAL